MHVMKLQPKYFDYIKNGTKKFEIRLNDDKRRKIKKGDFIEFQKEPLREEKIIYEVKDILYFNDFKELIDSIDIKYLADINETKEDLLNSLNRFYTKEDQIKFGVVAINLNKKDNFTIEKDYISKIDSSDLIFSNIKDNYENFDKWYLKLCKNKQECFFTKNDNKISSVMVLKINENDSQQLNKKNLLKIRTFNILKKNNGIGSYYLKLIDDIAKDYNIDIIYVTLKKDNIEFQKFIKKNNYINFKELGDEYIFIKKRK